MTRPEWDPMVQLNRLERLWQAPDSAQSIYRILCGFCAGVAIRRRRHEGITHIQGADLSGDPTGARPLHVYWGVLSVLNRDAHTKALMMNGGWDLASPLKHANMCRMKSVPGDVKTYAADRLALGVFSQPDLSACPSLWASASSWTAVATPACNWAGLPRPSLRMTCTPATERPRLALRLSIVTWPGDFLRGNHPSRNR
jgi:hypothetical protein